MKEARQREKKEAACVFWAAYSARSRQNLLVDLEH